MGLAGGAVVAAVLSGAAIAVIVLAPWRTVRKERPLDHGTESRLLLGEDPVRVAADLDAEEAARTEAV